MSIVLSDTSMKKLVGVHPDLVRVVEAAAQLSTFQFGVTEGLRTKERQTELVRAGASQTMRSRHLTGHAVDLAVFVGNEVRWDWPLYERLSTVMKAAAGAEKILVEWGGDFPHFKDGPHYQLPWAEYPA